MSMERPPQKIRLELSPQAEKYARRDAPRDVRLMAARGAVLERILAFLGVPAPARDEDEDEDEPPPIAVEEVSEQEARAALEVVLGTSFAALVEEHEQPVDEKELEQGGGLYALIQNLSVFQKIKLARMGNKEARSLLVRDRNKIVAMAAVSSPKITEQELLHIAQSRNVGDEVIRVICRNKDVTRSYQIKHALSTNPKTPQAIAMKFVNYLQDKDLAK